VTGQIISIEIESVFFGAYNSISMMAVRPRQDYSYCQNTVPLHAKAVQVFFRYDIKLGSRNITNPSGHYASEADST